MSDTTRNATLADLANLLRDQHARKLDVVTPSSKIRAEGGRLVISGTEPVLSDDGVTMTDGAYLPTEVCDEGIAAKLNIPTGYLRRMRQQRADLYDANINGWLSGMDPAGGRRSAPVADADPRSFLVRCFRGQEGGEGVARAFLSDRYGIVDNLDVLTAALDGVKRAGVDVQIDGCDLSDRRMYVRVIAPEVQAYAADLLDGYRSPFTGATGTDNPTVFAGFVISNSEVGGGAFSIVPRLVVQVCKNGMTRTADALRAVHLGSKQEDGVIQWSLDTQRKALELVTARARDAVATFLDVEYMRRALDEIRDKAGKPVHDAPAVVETVSKRLQFSQEQQATVLDHFIKGGQLTAGGVMHAVTSAAQTLGDADAAYDMEAAGLRALDIAAGAR